MSIALMLVAVLVGLFFYWEGKVSIDNEIRGRALYVARELSALIADDIFTENKHEIGRKISFPFTAGDAGNDLLYIIVYRHDGTMLVGSCGEVVFFQSDASCYTPLPGGNDVLGDVSLSPGAFQAVTPYFLLNKAGIYDLTVPVLTGVKRTGFVRVGISSERYAEKFSTIVKTIVVALIGILVVGMAFSQIITIGITKPILRLSEAAEKISRQNWEAPLEVKGKDEISKLGQAFNHMAITLKERESSLSSWNRDLFILHTAGLDLMESLDIATLGEKIAARADDLVRAETTTISAFDKANFALYYLGVHGSKAQILKEQNPPLESGGLYNWLACYGTPLLIADAQSDFRLNNEQMKLLGIRSIMMVPLWSSNSLTGLLTVVNKKGGVRFDKHDLRLFTVFGSLAGAALQNASLYTDLKVKMDELKNTQQQLVHSSKMAAIGELSANIAHEINNPLTSVLGYTTHLLKTLDLAEAPRRILGMMEQETLRVRKIIRNLLDFSRQHPSRMQPADLRAPIKETVSLVRGMAEASLIHIFEDYPTAPVIVSMDHNEIKQVFINIANNALQAMPAGGELHIRVCEARGQQILVEFQDTGSGITPDNLGKIFDPFFSTKGNSSGTGLGLSISYRIMQSHGGKIEAESQSGQGAIFRVYFPVDDGPQPR